MADKKLPPGIKLIRQYGIRDLKNYIEKLKKNIKVFEEAIEKEEKEIKRTRQMIKVLENDIKEAKSFKKLNTKR